MNVENEGETIINLKVKPNSPKFRVYYKECLRVDLTSSPDKNKANRELVSGLRRFFSSEVRLISGHKSRSKIVLVKAEKHSVETLIKKLEHN